MPIIDTLLNPNGRINRIRFWLANLIMAAMTWAVLWAAPSVRAGILPVDTRLAAVMLLALPLTWMAFCLLVKRWHDRNRSGLFVIISLIPVVGWLWVVIECGFMPGTRGANKYGVSPLRMRHQRPSYGDISDEMADPSGATYSSMTQG